MKLIGSIASPFVRRIRIQLGDRPFEFKVVNVFTEEGQQEIAKYCPTRRVPVLVDDEKVIWDSMLIAEYLSKHNLSIDQKKEMTLVNEMSDAGIQLFQLRKFELDKEDASVFSENNSKRIRQCLEYFDLNTPKSWDLTAQWLYCTLDWFLFRDVYKWQFTFPSLNSWFFQQKAQPFVGETDPRLP